MHRAALVAMLLSGCDFAFRLDHVDPAGPPPDPDAMDAMVVADAAPPPCVPYIDEQFDDAPAGMECSIDGHGGTVESLGGSLVQTGGQLIITPQPAIPHSGASCFTNVPVPFRPDGIIVEVSEAVRGDGDYTTLSSSTLDVTLTTNKLSSLGTGSLVLQDEAGQNTFVSIPYDPTMRWWRLRPGTGEVIAEYSIDGRTWVPIGARTIALSSNIQIGLHAGFNSSAGSGRAVYERLIICN